VIAARHSITGVHWAALAAQTVAAIAAAFAAVFAYLAARRMKKQQEHESRVRASEHLKQIHRLITELVDAAHNAPGNRFRAQLYLRSELGVTTVPLPKCVELVDPSRDELVVSDDPRRSTFDTLASAAMAEVEEAQRSVWKDEIVEVIQAQGDGRDEQGTGRPEARTT
jgi:hypothetical protein